MIRATLTARYVRLWPYQPTDFVARLCHGLSMNKRSLVSFGVLLLVATACTSTTVDADDDGTVFGVWEVIELNGRPPVSAPSVTFSVQPHPVNSGDSASGDLHSMRGNDGCNSFSGAFGIDGDRLFLVSIFRTQMLCFSDETIEQGDAFLALVGTASWAVSDDRLTLTGSDGTVAVLDRA